eukprot:14168047-Ditylum_brightwellii.AAC.1
MQDLQQCGRIAAFRFWSGPAMFSTGSLPLQKTSIIQPKKQSLPNGQDKDRMVVHLLALAFNNANSITA